jgi:TrkA domain protein
MEVVPLSFYRESDLPGIGKKITFMTHSGDKATLIIHHDGKREFYIMDKEGEPLANVTMLDEEARRIGSFISGITYKPKSIEDLELKLEGIEIEWFTLEASSPIVGLRLGGLGVRKRTQVSIIAVINKDGFTPNPSSEYVFNPGDICVVIGDPNNFKYFHDLVQCG